MRRMCIRRFAVNFTLGTLMASKISTYFKSGQIDYLSHFGTTWIGFNDWYNLKSNASTETQRVIDSVASNAGIAKAFNALLAQSNNTDSFLTKTLEDLGYFEYKDTQGNPVKTQRDVTGTKLRLRCNNTCDVFEFLYHAKQNHHLRHYLVGAKLFNNLSISDPLFKKLYLEYKRHMIEHMYLPYDALNGVSSNLDNINIQTYGRLLFFNLENQSYAPSIYTYDQIFGKGFSAKIAKLGSSQKKLKSTYTGAKLDSLLSAKQAKGKSLLELTSLVLYKLRCAYFHGDLDPNSAKNQVLGEYGHKVLCFIIRSIK